jgi:hypothetical protein
MYHRLAQTALTAAASVRRVVIADIEGGRERDRLDAHVEPAGD